MDMHISNTAVVNQWHSSHIFFIFLQEVHQSNFLTLFNRMLAYAAEVKLWDAFLSVHRTQLDKWLPMNSLEFG